MAIVNKRYDTSGRLVPELTENLYGLYVSDTNWRPHKEIFPEWRGNAIWMYKNDAGNCLFFVTLSGEDNFPVGRIGSYHETEKDGDKFIDEIIMDAPMGEDNAKQYPVLALLAYAGFVHTEFESLAYKCNRNLEELFDLSTTALLVIQHHYKTEYVNIRDIHKNVLELIKFFAMYGKTSKEIFSHRQHVENICKRLGALTPGWFERFGIRDHQIEKKLEEGISLGYFLSRKDTEKPIAAYFIEQGQIKSYLSKDDEIFCWRNYTDFMKKQIDSIYSDLD